MAWEEEEKADQSEAECRQALKQKWKEKRKDQPGPRDGKHATSHQQALAMCQSVPGVTSAHDLNCLSSHHH